MSGVAQLPTGRSARLPPSLRVALGCAQGPTGATLPFGTVRCAHPPGKSPLLPILTAGLAMSRAMELDSFQQLLERARARLFPPSKWAGLFPSAAYRRSAPPQAALGRLKWRRLGCSDAAEMVSQRRKTGLFFCGWRYPYTNSTAWDTSKRLGYFCNKKSQRGLLSTLTFLCEP